MLDAKGEIISPPLARQFMAQIVLKFGPFWDELDFWIEMHPSQNVQWECCGIEVQKISPPENFDYAKMPPRTFAGLPLQLNAHLSPTVILLRKDREVVGEIGRLGLTNPFEEVVNA